MSDKPAPAAGGPPGADGAIPSKDDIMKIKAQKKMQQQQAEVDQVIGIMHKNVENVLERDSKLSELEERADALQDGSAQFEKQAGALKNKFWLENLKSMIAMGVVAVIVLGLLYWKFSSPAPPAYYPPPPPPPPQQNAAPAGGAESSGGDEGGSSEGGSDRFI
jgi:vesicle-associated membrane protein 2